MMLISRTFWRIVGLTILVTGSWCVYSDQKRRKEGKQGKVKLPPKSSAEHRINRPSKDVLQMFFLQEIDAGERLIVEGNYEESILHFINAVVVCDNPGKLLSILKQTLPPPLYQTIKSEIRAMSV